MEADGLEMKQGPDMSPAIVDSEVEAVNGSQKGESADVRSVLVVGAGPAGLMLAYVHTLWPIVPLVIPSCPCPKTSLSSVYQFHTTFIFGPISCCNRYKHTNILLGQIWPALVSMFRSSMIVQTKRRQEEQMGCNLKPLRRSGNCDLQMGC
jgi:hypothetical protein